MDVDSPSGEDSTGIREPERKSNEWKKFRVELRKMKTEWRKISPRIFLMARLSTRAISGAIWLRGSRRREAERVRDLSWGYLLAVTAEVGDYHSNLSRKETGWS
jgi:hypothetical protein